MVIGEPGGTRSPWLAAASVCEQHGDEHVGQPALAAQVRKPFIWNGAVVTVATGPFQILFARCIR
jgi:hypothetical protein